MSEIDTNTPSFIDSTLLPSDSSYLDVLQEAVITPEVVDIQSINIDPSQEELFSTAASSMYNNTVSYPSAIPSTSLLASAPPLLPLSTNLDSFGIVEEVLSRGIVPYPSPATTSITSVSGQNPLSPTSPREEVHSPRSPTAPSTTVSPLMHSIQLQRQRQQSMYSAVGDGTTTALIPSTPEMPSSSSVVSSPGLPSEEAVMQSFTGHMMHDTFYMHANLPAEHPRNDPTCFVYLPSEFEYGDAGAPTPSPGPSGSSHSSP